MKRSRPRSASILSGASSSRLSFATPDPRRASCTSLASARHHPRFDFEILPTMADIDPFVEEPEENHVGFDFTGPIVPGITTRASSPSGTPLDPPSKAIDEDNFELPWNEFDAFDGPRKASINQTYVDGNRVQFSREDVTDDGSWQTPTQSSTASESVRGSDETRTVNTPRNPIAAIASKLSRLSFRRRRQRHR